VLYWHYTLFVGSSMYQRLSTPDLPTYFLVELVDMTAPSCVRFWRRTGHRSALRQ